MTETIVYTRALEVSSWAIIRSSGGNLLDHVHEQRQIAAGMAELGCISERICRNNDWLHYISDMLHVTRKTR